jgi:two-component system sensor histidine kinase UhpB
VLVAWRATHSVQTELQAALDVTNTKDVARELRHLVATFDGNRHVRATLMDANGTAAATSELFPPTQHVPGWFGRLIARAPLVVRLPVPVDIGAGGMMILQTDPVNETSEVWAQSLDAMLVLSGFAA